MISQKYR